MVTKYKSIITIGATTEPSSNPNFNHNLFGIVKTLGTTKANIKNETEMMNAHNRRPSELFYGYKATITNTIENKIPKDFSDPRLMDLCLITFDCSFFIFWF